MRRLPRSASAAPWVAASLLLSTSGCVSDVTPNQAADLGAYGTPTAGSADAQPAATLPTALAVARVATPPHGGASLHVVGLRDVERAVDVDRLRKLPWVAGVAPLAPPLISSHNSSPIELRAAARSVHADLLLLYTIGTDTNTDDVAPPVGLVTLGLFPTRVASTTSTASAVLLDSATGYVYATVESTADADQLANGWTTDEAREDAKARSERRAFAGLVSEVERVWPMVIHNRPHARAGGNLPPPTGWVEVRPETPSGPTNATPGS